MYDTLFGSHTPFEGVSNGKHGHYFYNLNSIFLKAVNAFRSNKSKWFSPSVDYAMVANIQQRSA